MDPQHNAPWRAYALTDFPSATSLSSQTNYEDEELPELLTHHVDPPAAHPDDNHNPPMEQNDYRSGNGEDNLNVDGNKKKEDDARDDEFSNYFTIERCDHAKVNNAVFLLSAPNSFWLKERDWIQGSSLQIKCRKNLLHTPLIRRLLWRYKKVKRQYNGKNFKNPIFLNRITVVHVLRGEVENEEEIVNNLPSPPSTPPPQDMDVNDVGEPEVTGPEILLEENEALKEENASLKNSLHDLRGKIEKMRIAISANGVVLDQMLEACSSCVLSTEKERASWEYQEQLVHQMKENHRLMLL